MLVRSPYSPAATSRGCAPVGFDSGRRRSVWSRAEHAAEAEPEVHRHADHQCNIGLPQVLLTAHGRTPVRGRPVPLRGPFRSSAPARAAPRPVSSKAFSACPHHTLVPAMITGRWASASSRTAASRALPSGLTGTGGSAQGTGPARVVRLAEDVIHREIHERDTPDGAPTAARSASSINAADRIGRLRGGGEPRQRRHERHVIDLLQRALPPARSRAPARRAPPAATGSAVRPPSRSSRW